MHPTLLLVLAGTLLAAPVDFDVASIKSSKLSGEGNRRESIEPAPLSLTMRNVSLRSAIRWAYGIQDVQIAGPDWLSAERFDIVAKPATPARVGELKEMLQTLLANRFKLTLHRQTKDLPVFALTVEKNGPKFHDSPEDGPSNMQKGKAGVIAQRTSMQELADELCSPLQAPVVDMTGLKGRYDFALDLGRYFTVQGKGGDGPAPDIADIVATAIREQLGLKVERRKAPIEILVVDHAERVPTEN
jgi:uncharacterized protein (TIGR03435 family)